jgi:hypothetical protein
MPEVVILCHTDREHRILGAVYDDVPLLVALEPSAAMKLIGNRIGELNLLEEATAARIAAATGRILRAAQRIPPKVVLTALDLD